MPRLIHFINNVSSSFFPIYAAFATDSDGWREREREKTEGGVKHTVLQRNLCKADVLMQLWIFKSANRTETVTMLH